jgi:hypothetical protein
MLGIRVIHIRMVEKNALAVTQGKVKQMIGSLIGLVGAPRGILLGHSPTRSDHHEDWLRDTCREEYPEVGYRFH